MKIEYPENIKCPSCKSVIKLDYSDKNYVRTDDLLIMNIYVPQSRKGAKDMRSNKQDLHDGRPGFIICKRCQTILGSV